MLSIGLAFTGISVESALSVHVEGRELAFVMTPFPPERHLIQVSMSAQQCCKR